MIVNLPAGFPFATYLSGSLDAKDTQFFVMPTHQLTFEGLSITDDRATFTYLGRDSDEGEVRVTYVSTGGDPAVAGHVDGFDVEITTGSDVWGLEDTLSAVQDAIALHRALGHNKGFDRDVYGQ